MKNRELFLAFKAWIKRQWLLFALSDDGPTVKEHSFRGEIKKGDMLVFNKDGTVSAINTRRLDSH